MRLAASRFDQVLAFRLPTEATMPGSRPSSSSLEDSRQEKCSHFCTPLISTSTAL